jgi:hypothetical protein
LEYRLGNMLADLRVESMAVSMAASMIVEKVD